ncbi:ras-like protein family member 12 [Artemia franciscana]|uniref:small monomeric GTPase n=1 Tax=Artemia franciscana TaxID=6661 RepID=A0AA88HNL1_ARTSF|nr:hypothetical protein QYM36_009459 [Artemia franciscana]KAK2713585.1 hypothetical protein QYM36_009459 [Artemia franciscana]
MANKRSRLLLMGKSNGSQGSYEINIAVVGSSGCGKSALTVRFMTRRFISEYDPELEGTYLKQDIVDGSELTFRVMDTCDKEGRDPSRYLLWTDAYIVVYSITNHDSFVEAQKYLELISQRDVIIGVVGNKADLEKSREVTYTEGSNLSCQYDATFHEISVAENYSEVENVFLTVAKDFLRLQERSGSWKIPGSLEDRSIGLGDRLRSLGSSKLNIPRDKENKFTLLKDTLKNMFQSQ